MTTQTKFVIRNNAGQFLQHIVGTTAGYEPRWCPDVANATMYNTDVSAAWGVRISDGELVRVHINYEIIENEIAAVI